MKKIILLTAFSICCAIAGSFLTIDNTVHKQVIYIKNGDPVVVDSITKADGFFLYEADGNRGMFMENDVSGTGTLPTQIKTSVLEIVDRTKRQIMMDMGLCPKLVNALDSRILIFIAVFCVTFFIIKITFLMIGVIKGRISAASPENDTLPDTKNKLIIEYRQEDSEYRDIILFFLELFKIQNGLAPNAPSRFSIRSKSKSKKRKLFDLDVKGKHDWISRRMSIAPLGEDSGSKSKCFYVIYDTHMVVKIPPEKITDLDKYITAIRKEVQIAGQLTPVACIVPMVSVVLKKVKKLPYESSLTQEQLEKQYIRLVEEHPEYQSYLKIGGRFAFFMELANNFFLGGVIDSFHKIKTNIREELQASPELAWSQEAFINRYGFEALPVFKELQELYRKCEVEAKRLIKESGRDRPVHQYQIKNWFLATLTDDALPAAADGMDADLLKRITEAFLTIFKTNQDQIDRLVLLLKTKQSAKTFRKNRPQIQNICSNMLTLLCRLKEKRIALRDLKPDNLFLDADPDAYPGFLSDPSAFSIGVIDVETAVSIDPRPDGSIAQPLIGGTPLYATPIHLLKNKAITENFEDLPHVLHLQDWYATVAILFKAITGANLFPRAARTFPGSLKILKTSQNPSSPDSATVQKMSRLFWAAAATDIKKQTVAFSTVLDQISVNVPEAMADAIKKELAHQQKSLDKAIHKQISLSPLMKSKKNQDFLIGATTTEITRQIGRWKDTTNLPENHRQLADKMVPFLTNLNILKKGEKEKSDTIAAFDTQPYEIKAKPLIEAIFHIVFQEMYKKRWKTLVTSPAKKTDEQLAVKEDSNLVATVLVKA